MRYLFILFFSFTLTISQAQNFEGIIKWSFTADIPALDKNAAPSNAAAKALQEKMNDPEFQKQMEQSPALKKMLEEQLSKLQEGSFLSSLIPTGMTIQIKDGNSLTKIIGGPGTEVLNLKDKSYILNRAKKTYSVVPEEDNKKAEKADKITVTATNETSKILNYTCKKYIVEDAGGIKIIVWATTDIKGVDFKAAYDSKNLSNSYFSKIEGFPLKIESNNNSAQFTMEATEITQAPQKAEDFKIPADFTEK